MWGFVEPNQYYSKKALVISHFDGLAKIVNKINELWLEVFKFNIPNKVTHIRKDEDSIEERGLTISLAMCVIYH